MKISEQWLRQWVNPANMTTQELGEQLTMAGLEIDDILSVAAPFSGVVVGEVVDVQPHPDADKLRITQVNIGDGETKQIVCGAPNVYVGLKAPVATIGAILPSDDGGFKIKKSKLRGVESYGMLCGASEIDLPDAVDGLLELPADAPVGIDIREFLGLDNKILDISITPNRGDCFSVKGIARELAVLNQLEMTAPDFQAPDVEADITQAVSVEATEACPRYLAQPIRGIDRSVATPAWMQQALVQSGLRSHNFLVDVTNYVLSEMGQPLHAFDADKIVGAICVRFAKAGETLVLLNEQTLTLTGDELVIADDKGVLALAGIMGGLRSSVTDTTCNIVLESAFFDPIAIAGRARRFGLHTDSSQRFERGVDFELAPDALARAASLITEIASAQAGHIITVETVEALPVRDAIILPVHKVTDVLGISIDKETIVRILSQLGILVDEVDTQTLRCIPPSYRYDLSIAEDLIEEIARIYGYDRIPSQLPSLSVDMRYDDGADLTMRLKLALVEAGYMEAVSFSFSDAKLETLLEDKALGEMLPLANPISADLAVMRRTLLSSLLPCVQYNLNRQQSRVRFFETGLSFVGANVSELVQTPSVALIATGTHYPEQAYDNHAIDFFDLKHDVQQLIPSHIEPKRISYRRSQLAFLHPGQSAEILIDGKVVGWLGQLHPNVAKQLDLPQTWVAQLALSEILALMRFSQPIASPSKYPQIRRDIALLVDEDVELQTLSTTISEVGGDLLSQHWLFDVYQGEHTPKGLRSLAFALIWQDATQTLSDESIKKVMDNVISELHSRHGAQLRDG